MLNNLKNIKKIQDIQTIGDESLVINTLNQAPVFPPMQYKQIVTFKVTNLLFTTIEKYAVPFEWMKNGLTKFKQKKNVSNDYEVYLKSSIIQQRKFWMKKKWIKWIAICKS